MPRNSGCASGCSSIPDGIYRARDYIDHDGHTNRLYEVCLAVIRQGDDAHLRLERHLAAGAGFHQLHLVGHAGALFTGTAADSGAATSAGTKACCAPVTIRRRRAISAMRRWPAPVSGATVSTVWMVQNVAVAALSRMVSRVPATGARRPRR